MIVENKLGYEILTPNGFKSFDGLQYKTKQKLKFSFVNMDDTITVSVDHIFNYDDSETNTKLASDIEIGDWMSHEEVGFIQVENIEELPEGDVIDVLEVKDENHIYIANGLKHHNCSFIGSSKTIVTGDCLEDLNNSIKDPVDFKYDSLLKIYEQPINGAQYILGIDPAEGLGQDASAIQVLRIMDESNNVKADMSNQYKLKQVATYKSNRIKPKQFAQACIGVARYFNLAWMMVENNNSAGGLVCHHIWVDFEYENLVNPTKTKNGKLGINSNSKSKYDANMKMADMLEHRTIQVVDKDTIQEINTYEEVSPKRFAACYSSAHDDLVTSLMWGIWFIETKWFEGYGEEQGSDISDEFYIEPPSFVNASNRSSLGRGNPQPTIGNIMQQHARQAGSRQKQQGRWF